MTHAAMKQHTETNESAAHDYLEIYIGEQMFGIPVLQVQDVLAPLPIARVPLAPPAVAGSLNLRGRIVTVIELRECLGLPPRENAQDYMSVVIENEGELFSLIIDRVGDVLKLDTSGYEKTPPTLDQAWRDICNGVQRMENALMVILDVSALLNKLQPFTDAERI